MIVGRANGSGQWFPDPPFSAVEDNGTIRTMSHRDELDTAVERVKRAFDDVTAEAKT